MTTTSPVQVRGYRPPAPFAKLQSLEFPEKLITFVKAEDSVRYMGRFDAEKIAQVASNFVAENSDAQQKDMAHIFTKFLDMAAKNCHEIAHPAVRDAITQHCMFDVLIYKPSDKYAVPDWHREDTGVRCLCPKTNPDRPAPHHALYGVTLLGPPTRVLEPSPAVDAAWLYRKAAFGSGSGGEGIRQNMADRLKDQPEVELARGAVIRFSVGQDDSPMHSPPDWTGQDRVFATIEFGTKAEMPPVEDEWDD